MIDDIEEYFSRGCGRCDRFGTSACSTRTWSSGLEALRRICRESPLVETVKWGHPCYMHAGRNIAVIGAFRNDFRLAFMNAALLQDRAGVLEKQGPNTRHPDALRFTDDRQVAERAPIILAYLQEAMSYAERGVKPAKETRDPTAPADLVADLPAELGAALASDAELARAFRDLTPGRQRSYLIAVGSAKTAATRTSRIQRLRSKIIAGKGALER